MDDAVAAPSLIRPSASTQWKTAQYRFCHCTSMLSSPSVVVEALICQFSLKEYSMANSWLFTSPSCCEVETKTFSRTYVPAPIRLLFNVSPTSNSRLSIPNVFGEGLAKIVGNIAGGGL